MSWHATLEPECTRTSGAVDLIIEPKEKDLGEFTVRRVLPAAERRMVGPFIFFDHMGPAEFPPGEGIAVRPHPHIGLATITYLFEGEILHRDSLGFVQPIRPGAVNLMTAGRGIVHSERAGEDLAVASRLHGIQSWIALPDEHEETVPAFVHYSAEEIPQLQLDSVQVRLIMGEGFGAKSPVTLHSPTLYAELVMPADASTTVPRGYEERAVYVVSGNVDIDGREIEGGVMVVACPDEAVQLRARSDSLVMVIGGSPVGERHIWWNFVSSRRERMERAKQDWKAGRFEMVPGDGELIPLPD